MPGPTTSTKKRRAPLCGLRGHSPSCSPASSCSCGWCQQHHDEDITDEQTRVEQKRTKLHGSSSPSMFPPPINRLYHHGGTCHHHSWTGVDDTAGNPSRPSYQRIGSVIEEIKNSCRQHPLSLAVPFVSMEQPQEDDKATTHRRTDCTSTPVTTTPTQPSIRTKKDSKHQPRMLRRNSFLIPKHKHVVGMTLFQVTGRTTGGGGGGDDVFFF